MVGTSITYILYMMKLRQKEIKLLTHNHTEIYGTVLLTTPFYGQVCCHSGADDTLRETINKHTQRILKKKKKKILKEFPERRETNRLIFIESLQYACQAMSQALCIHVLFNLSNSRY